MKITVNTMEELVEKLDELDGSVDRVVINVPWGTKTRELEFSDFKEIVGITNRTKRQADEKWDGSEEDEEGLEKALDEINAGFDEVKEKFGIEGTSVMADIAAGTLVPFRKLVIFVEGGKLYIHGFEDDSCLL